MEADIESPAEAHAEAPIQGVKGIHMKASEALSRVLLSEKRF